MARVETTAAWDEFQSRLQAHLLEVTIAYWDLYLRRAAYLQKSRWRDQAQIILEQLESRRELDARQSQILRARGAVASRGADLVRAAAAIQNTEARIRGLVYSSGQQGAQSMELVPLEAPLNRYISVGLEDALVTAMKHRPEIDQAIQQIRAASIRLNVSKNELLPQLNLIAETYVAGLDGDTDLDVGYRRQFTEGEPGFTIGFTFETPLGNRGAKSRFIRRQLEHRRLVSQFQATLQMLRADVEVAVREVDATYREMAAKHQSTLAAAADVRSQSERWRTIPDDRQGAGIALELLLDAQDRQATEEYGYLQAQRDYAVSLTQLKKETGSLLQSERVVHRRECVNGVPQLRMDKAPNREGYPVAIPQTSQRIRPRFQPRDARGVLK